MKRIINNESQILVWFSLFLFYFISFTSAENEYILELSTPASTFQVDNNVKIRYVYDSDIFNGVSVEFKSNQDAQQFFIDKRSSILKSWPIIHHTNPKHNNKHNKPSTFFVPEDKGTLYELTRANYAYKNLKLNGSGVKVGIIDSGVDYTHPALGGCFGKGCKVAYGYDLVGNDYDGSLNSIKPSHDPIDNCPTNSTSATGHGTFLAGIIAAEDKEYNWTGVAPGVTLGMWKVYGCNYGSASNDIIVKALEMAYKAGMDIINLSLGIHGGWEEQAFAEIVSRIVSKGVHVVAAIGNIGSNGIFLPSSPASGKDVIAVGATMNERVPGYIMKVFSKDTLTIPYRTYTNTPLVLSKKLSIVSSSDTFNKENDACKPFKHNKFSNTIMLIHLGDCNALTQVKNAKEAGAKAVVFYSDITNATTDTETLSSAVLPVVFVNNDQGRRIFSAINKKKKVKAQFTNTLVAMEATELDLLHAVSGFSSQGPTNELQLKPEIMGVGGNVFSTYPSYLKYYGFESGTSMAAPYVSGQIALLLEKQKDLKPNDTKNILMNFATQVRPPISDSQYGDSPIRQGAGKIDVVQAVHGLDTFHAFPPFLGLNDTAHFKEQQEITFYNHDKHNSLTLHLHHQPSLTATGYSTKHTNYTPSEPVGLYKYNNSVSLIQFSQKSIVIPPGQSTKVTVHIQPPTHTFPKTWHAIYGGYIKATTNQADISIPYLGMIGNMKDLPILDRINTSSNSIGFPFPSIGSPFNNHILGSKETGHFTIKHSQNQTIGGPYVVVRLLTGTRLLQIQILNKKNKVIGDMPLDNLDMPRVWLMRMLRNQVPMVTINPS
ncbi:hypothetical protein RO3G_12287 [Rhizopus delemar RA 99-880]|uniref:Peptidase S8/S53 domain-containing protein n=1 Tax=Rhizopus delemar (strain RA 99-880 / ATCC MYA-4621 / FGSC 9543 / NRRL 43880) TaxID=246409 RepID=I1CGJ6_RHIO9|nr:hypothetical protein RO3G_12287 [Rhizopus delemar RA 99-880]|eukprot:EIE87576.1 hypothetical protein RO3G_12287 [Rhizopus delemar RA 99-880]